MSREQVYIPQTTKSLFKNKTWKKCYFSLTEQLLCIYKKETGTESFYSVSTQDIISGTIGNELRIDGKKKYPITISIENQQNPLIIGVNDFTSAEKLKIKIDDAYFNGIAQQFILKSSQVKIEKQIGQGAFGKVYKGTYIGDTVAIKEIFKQDSKELIKREVLLLCRIKSSNCVRLRGIYYNERNILHIVTDFINGGTLQDLLAEKKLSAITKLKISRDIANGLAYLHGEKIVHRDLKSDNCMIKSIDKNIEYYEAVICDFGISKFASKGTSIDQTSVAGTPVYMAPECFSDTITDKIDVFAYGILLNEIFTEERPWSTRNDIKFSHQIFDLIDNGERPNVDIKNCGFKDEIYNLIKECWTQKPEDRPSMQIVRENLDKLINKYGNTPIVSNTPDITDNIPIKPDNKSIIDELKAYVNGNKRTIEDFIAFLLEYTTVSSASVFAKTIAEKFEQTPGNTISKVGIDKIARYFFPIVSEIVKVDQLEQCYNIPLECSDNSNVSQSLYNTPLDQNNDTSGVYNQPLNTSNVYNQPIDASGIYNQPIFDSGVYNQPISSGNNIPVSEPQTKLVQVETILSEDGWSISKINEFLALPHFVGFMDFNQFSKYLYKGTPGQFLIRFSRRDAGIVVGIAIEVRGSLQVVQWPLAFLANGRFRDNTSSSQYESLQDFINKHREKPLSSGGIQFTLTNPLKI